MTVLDAQAVLAYLKEEPAAVEAGRLMDQGAELTTIGVAEVIDHLIRVLGLEEDRAMIELATLDLPEARLLDAELMVGVGRLRARQYHRRSREVSLADCIAAEVARAAGTGLATSDPHLLDLCHEEGIATIPLPDSRGRTWTAPA